MAGKEVHANETMTYAHGRGEKGQMKYVTHHRFKELALCGKQLNIPYGTELECTGKVLITSEGKAVCYRRSENAKQHFARNDDGKGLERGRLTYAIAYSFRDAGNGYRFSEEEAKILAQDWEHFLQPECDVIRFNDNFFSAEPEEIQKLADALNIKVRR